jgi:uncharacterized membrane protein YfcA
MAISADIPGHILVLLGTVGLAAGFVDAIAGGGGLITVPALMLTLIPAGIPVSYALGTNKGQSVFGSGMALVRYAHSPLLDKKRARVAFLPSLVGAALGVEALLLLRAEVLRPLVMVLLAGVAVFMLFYRPPQVKADQVRRSIRWAALSGFVIAGYDGFFGPGTGTFCILAYALTYHDPLDAASANAKVVNFASNLASLVIFAWRGLIIWKVALPMAAGQAIGAWLGAHVTVKSGRGVVRIAVMVISLALVARRAWQFWFGG